MGQCLSRLVLDVTSSPRTRSRTMSMGVSGRSLSSDGTRARTRPWLSVRRRHLRRLTNREADAWEIPRAAASSAGAVHGGILAITRRHFPERPALAGQEFRYAARTARNFGISTLWQKVCELA